MKIAMKAALQSAIRASPLAPAFRRKDPARSTGIDTLQTAGPNGVKSDEQGND